MSLKLSWEWQSAPEVRTGELSATWSRLTIEVDEIIATLVEERGQSHGVRKSLDVPTYPLAEWIAFNWWQLNANAHRPGDAGVRLAAAGSGFPWPDITLRSDRGLIWADVRQRDNEPEFVKFLAQGRAVLDGEQAVGEVSRFVDATVRRLEESGIEGTLLQDEWNTIQQAGPEESDFCLVAAAWGLDPYDVPGSIAADLIETDRLLGDSVLLADLARAVDLESLTDARMWVRKAINHVVVGTFRLPTLGSVSPPMDRGIAPWREGYRRATQLRDSLRLPPIQPVSVEDYVAISTGVGEPPINVDALVKVTSSSTGIVIGSRVGDPGRRFAGARALARKSLEPRTGLSLLTQSSQYMDKVERAFAAEFLAPAVDIQELLSGDYSEDSQRRVAQQLQVSPQLIQHQVENQLAV